MRIIMSNIKKIAEEILKKSATLRNENKQNIPYRIGDKVTFYYSKYNPDQKGIVTAIKGDDISIKSSDSGKIYVVHYSNVKHIT
jgi:hypothetical protein